MTGQGISPHARQEAGRRQQTHLLWRIIRIVLVGLLGGWLAVIFAGGVKMPVGPMVVRGELRPAWSGETRLDLPPAGALSAPTHHGPIRLVARVEEVHVGPLVKWVKSGVDDRMLPGWLRPKVTRLALMRRRDDSVLVNAGTTGAEGVRYFTDKHRPAYGAAILSFVPGREPTLRYVDFIEVNPTDGGFLVQRRDLARWKNGKVFRLH